jgi:hypothetical protein
MATRSEIDATLQRYYQAWSDRDHDLYRSIWTDDATFADPPTDDEVPPTGVEEIVAGMESVWSRARSISYDRRYTWHCGHSVAVHSVVTMHLADDTVAAVPLLHVFRFAADARIRRLEAFLDFQLIDMVDGDRPDWLQPST